MVDSRIHDLTALASLAVGDLFAADDASNLAAASGKVTAQQIIDLAAAELLLDEDTMTSNSATKAPTQQSVKAYVDANAGGSGTAVSTTSITGDGVTTDWAVTHNLGTLAISPVEVHWIDTGGIPRVRFAAFTAGTGGTSLNSGTVQIDTWDDVADSPIPDTQSVDLYVKRATAIQAIDVAVNTVQPSDRHWSTISGLVGVIGDSNTSGGTLGEWFEYGIIASEGAVRYGGNWATGGEEAADAGGQVTSAINAGVDACAVMFGTNGVGDVADKVADIVTLWSSLITAGIQPIACTSFPRTDIPAEPIAINTLIREEAARLGVPLFDAFGYLVDVDQVFVAALAEDAIHSNTLGHLEVGRGFGKWLKERSGNPLVSLAYSGDSENILPSNGLMEVDTNADGVPDDNSDFSGAGWVVSLVADPDFEGQALQLVAPSATGGFGLVVENMSAASGVWDEGDELLMVGRLKILSAGTTASFSIESLGVSATVTGTKQISGPFDGWVQARMIVPVGATFVRPLMLSTTSTATTDSVTRFGMTRIVKLSTGN